MADMITHQEDTRAVVAPGPAPGRKHTLLGSIAALAMALTLFISGIGTARADTAQWSVRHVYMNLGSPGQSQQSQYYGLIRSLRDAAGHAWRKSARFYDVYQVMYNVMGNVPGLGDAGRGQPARYDGLPGAGQEYENNWSQISQ